MNPNPSPNHHQLRHPPLPNHHFTILNANPHPNFPPPPHDSTSALSALTNLIHITEQTLSSAPLSDLVRSLDKHADDVFAHCPYNPSHQLPASSLFTHYLTCPNSLPELNLILHSLRYPHTLETSGTKPVLPPADISEDELSFTVDGYGDVVINHFYNDCPGVVSLMQERDGEKKILTVPRVLIVECEDFKSARSDELMKFENGGLKLSVCEFWLGKCEVEGWNDYPGRCSLQVLKMLSNVCAISEIELKKWVILNSPRYGVVIDMAMRDHIVLLLKLCLRPMAKEAYKLAQSRLDLRVSKETAESNSMDISFDCDFMNHVLRWFVAQLTVLYGEVSGKHFGINMLKNCMVKAGLRPLLFQLEEKATKPQTLKEAFESFANPECVIRDSGVDLSGKKDVETGLSGNVHHEIRLSQVVAAVAALYERMALERKIRGFRHSQPLPKHQIVAEHDYLTNKAREERLKRLNYRSIVEHDGLIWQHSHIQDTNRKKTKEELLAEERDYKRRRMSYRGKKMKRSTTEVMRGIIEEYMEEIEHAVGIGCLVKGSAEARSFPNEPAYDEYPNACSGKSSSDDISDKSRRLPDSISKLPHHVNDWSNSVQPLSSKNYKRKNSEAYGFVEHFEDHRNSGSNRHDRDRVSSSSNKGGSQRRSEDRTPRKSDHKEMIKIRHESISMYNSRDTKSRLVSSTSNPRKHMLMNADELESRHMRQMSHFRNHSVSSDAIENRYDPLFDDRYDPSNSHTVLEHDDC